MPWRLGIFLSGVTVFFFVHLVVLAYGWGNLGSGTDTEVSIEGMYEAGSGWGDCGVCHNGVRARRLTGILLRYCLLRRAWFPLWTPSRNQDPPYVLERQGSEVRETLAGSWGLGTKPCQHGKGPCCRGNPGA